MPEIELQIRSGAYHDSVVLMQLQRALAALPGVLEAGVVMGTPANKELLGQTGLLPPAAQAAAADDLVVVVRGETAAAARDAIGKVDGLLARKRGAGDEEYRPQSLETAGRMLPAASWVLVSVAGRHASGVARQALSMGKHVFLFSDNVPVEDEVRLKEMAAARGLLVMGPDCGTAIVRGIGLGFANKVRRGPIGVVAAAGTGLQHVTSRIHQLGSGVTHGIGTGGRDLSEKVGAITFRQGIDVLARDPETRVIVLVSKPPAPGVASIVLDLAREAGKPVVVDFIGQVPPAREMDNLHFAEGLDDAAALAAALAATLAEERESPVGAEDLALHRFAAGQRYLRGLFSGGTLAYEAQHILAGYLPCVYANAPLKKELKLANSLVSQGHTIVDLGEDEFTVGRLHPMIDNELRIRRLRQEADDPETAVIMLDVVLGYGAHPDPAAELAPAIAEARGRAAGAGRCLEVVAVVTGTDEDPQGLNRQIELLRGAGARVEGSNEAMARHAGRLLHALERRDGAARTTNPAAVPVDLATLDRPLAAINVGMESFAETLKAQGAAAVHVDWRPPAGGNERLAAILERMKG